MSHTPKSGDKVSPHSRIEVYFQFVWYCLTHFTITLTECNTKL